MLVFLFTYLVTSFLVICVLNTLKIKTRNKVSNVKVSKCAINFFSKSKQTLNVEHAKVMQVENTLYLKNDAKLVVIKNVDEIIETQNQINFKACGNVEFKIDFQKYFRYFNIKVLTIKLDFEKIKERAIKAVINNPFSYEKNSDFIGFINLVKNVLNIEIDNKRLLVRKNIFLIPFTLTYKLNGKFKRVKVNCK